MNGIELSAALGACGALVWIACLYRRCTALANHIGRLEDDSLQHRRELWRLQRNQRPAPGGAPIVASARSDALTALGRASLEIGAELSEPRVLETTARLTAVTLGATKVRIVLHDRRMDRFARGPEASRIDGDVLLCDGAPRASEELLLRATIRRRSHLIRGNEDPTKRPLFDAAGPTVTAVAPIFDRALVTGLVVVEGAITCDGAEALDVLSTLCSLALANARLRNADGRATPTPPTPENSHA